MTVDMQWALTLLAHPSEAFRSLEGKRAEAERRKTADQRSQEIDAQLQLERRQRIQNRRQIKVLLLGPTGAGKSTVVEQLRLLQQKGGAPLEPCGYDAERYCQLAFDNVVKAMKDLLSCLDELGGRVLDENQTYADLVVGLDSASPQPRRDAHSDALRSLWSDSNVQKTFTDGGEGVGKLSPDASYFLSSLGRILDSGYKPTDEDIVRGCSQAPGLKEIDYNGIEGSRMVLVDTGARPANGKEPKWMHHFEDVHAAVFVVDLSSYDQCTDDDEGTNQMENALRMWENVCRSRWLRRSTLVLLFNKADLFAEKIKTTPIQALFSDYTGNPKSEDEGRAYFLQRFRTVLSQSSNHNPLFCHVINAMKAQELKTVMDSIQENILQLFIRTVCECF